MATFNKKHLFTHIWVVIMLALIALALLIYPSEGEGRTLIIIKHDNAAKRNATSPSLSRDSREISQARRNIERKQRQVERARQDVANAYIPRSELYQTTRFYDIQNAENQLYNAQMDLRAADNDLYWRKRIRESNERERQLNIQKRENKKIYKKIQNNPPYQEYDDE
ncbi:MAG: hypothetical protein HYX61_10960 [Gammaproteobacteria bacterium]|nr:hypothetical protein [Gammaproteobacteria bacterium]